MKKNHIFLFFIQVLFIALCQNSAHSEMPHEMIKNDKLSMVIPNYRADLLAKPVHYALVNKEMLDDVVLNQYEMTSQFWSPDQLVSPTEWKHDLDIYIPPNAKKHRALIVINNGINNDDASNRKPSNFQINTLKNIAQQTHTIVISISNIPNQSLIYQNDQQPVKEDDSVAKSWKLFMEQPNNRQLLPLHVPMATAVSQAMRIAKQELKPWKIERFIVTGASKRGWTSWLTAISDPDVDAIVPFAMDFLNIDVTLEHMYRAYGENWPIAFYPYYAQKLDTIVKTKNFSKLLEIEDPFRYQTSKYKNRLSIPKYIINASGDDFYVPDNSRFYYDQLQGVKSLRVVPNSDHAGIINIAEQSLISFINRYQNEKLLAPLESHVKNNNLTITFREKPVKIIRWTAVNTDARDFRYACGIKYEAKELPIPSNNRLKVPLTYKGKGWEATFVEATFNDEYVSTTQVYITPDEHYPNIAPPSSGNTCQTLPGRGLGR